MAVRNSAMRGDIVGYLKAMRGDIVGYLKVVPMLNVVTALR